MLHEANQVCVRFSTVRLIRPFCMKRFRFRKLMAIGILFDKDEGCGALNVGNTFMLADTRPDVVSGRESFGKALE